MDKQTFIRKLMLQGMNYREAESIYMIEIKDAEREIDFKNRILWWIATGEAQE